MSTSYITALRGPLALMVVLIHAMNAPWRAFFSSPVTAEARIIAEGLSYGLTAFAVPLFFIISGYLFFLRTERLDGKRYVEKLKRRVGTLLIPYLTWNMLAFVLYLIQDLWKGDGGTSIAFGADIFWNVNVVGAARENLFGITGSPTTGPILLPLWFVRDLIVLSLLSPLFYYLFKRLGVCGLLLLAVVYYLQLWPNYLGISFKGAWFFGLGAWLSLKRMDLPSRLRPLTVPILIVSGLLLLPCFVPSFSPDWLRPWLLEAYVLFGSSSAVLLAESYTRRRSPSVLLSQGSFFLYASHTIVLLPLTQGAVTLARETDQAVVQLTAYLACPALAAIISLGAFYLLTRYMPKQSRPLTGLR